MVDSFVLDSHLLFMRQKVKTTQKVTKVMKTKVSLAVLHHSLK